MNRREMLAAGFHRLAQVMPGLVNRRSLSDFLTGVTPTPSHQEALCFPPRRQDPAELGPEPLVEED